MLKSREFRSTMPPFKAAVSLADVSNREACLQQQFSNPDRGESVKIEGLILAVYSLSTSAVKIPLSIAICLSEQCMTVSNPVQYIQSVSPPVSVTPTLMRSNFVIQLYFPVILTTSNGLDLFPHLRPIAIAISIRHQSFLSTLSFILKPIPRHIPTPQICEAH